jgi:hypothetical protein
VKIRRDVEVASSIVVKSLRGERMYWTGSDWTSNMDKAKKYLREEAEKKANKKKSFVITTGFVPR